MQFYASNVGRSVWEGNILRGYRLRPDTHVLINLDDSSGYCRFDFKTVFADGTSIVRNNMNVCELDSYTVADRD